MTDLAERYDDPDFLAAHEAIKKLYQTMQKIQQKSPSGNFNYLGVI